MSDQKTLDAYDVNAALITARHLLQAPAILYRLMGEFAHWNKPTTDIGCGSGRDTAWLNQNNFPTIGFDASSAMIEQAKRQFPEYEFKKAELPKLDPIADASFANVFVCAVLMHIPRSEILSAIQNLLRITEDDGVLVISYRNTDSLDGREDGRLFEDYALDELAVLFESFGGKVMRQREDVVQGRDRIWWRTLVVCKTTRVGLLLRTCDE